MKLLWLDLETTGLDPHVDRILEVAACVADLASPFETRSCAEWAIFLPPSQVRSGIHEKVIEMHTRNGLWATCEASTTYLDEVERHLVHLAASGSGEEPTTLAGSSVHFDLGFIRSWMPDLAKHLSHRVYDVSAIKLFCQSLGMPKPPKAEAHRAMADVRESIAHARACAEWLKDGWAPRGRT